MTRSFKTQAMVNSLQTTDEVTIIHEKNNNDVIALYQSTLCTAIYNIFVGLYYVDDLYGKLTEAVCPRCGEYLTFTA